MADPYAHYYTNFPTNPPQPQPLPSLPLHQQPPPIGLNSAPPPPPPQTATAPSTTNGATTTTTKPLRAMLARGAACDTCRTRKVKCDGARPVCAQCTKSARGDASVINCVYEGGGGSASRANGGGATAGTTRRKAPTTKKSAAVAGGSGEGVGVGTGEKRGRSRSASQGGDGEDETEGPSRKKSGGAMSGGGGGGGGQRVETLVERITELERRLRLQASVQGHSTSSLLPPSSSSSSFPTQQQPQSLPSLSNILSSSNATDTPTYYPPQLFSSYPPAPPSILSGSSYPPLGAVPISAYPPLGTITGGGGGGGSSGYNDAGVSPAGSGSTPGSGSNGWSSGSGGGGASGSTTGESSMRSTGGEFGYNNNNNGLSTVYGNGGMNGRPTLSTSSSSSGVPTISNITPAPAPGIFDPYASIPSHPSSTSSSYPPALPLPSHTSPPTPHSSSSPSSLSGLSPSFLQLLYPSWPSSLPSPSIVIHLSKTFFTRCSFPSSIFTPHTFLSSLESLSPSTPLPHTALLHAVCGYASVLVAEESLVDEGSGKGRYWEQKGEKSAREWHYRIAREEVEKGVRDPGGNLFQVLQATLLCSYMAYQSSSFTDLWFLSGIATRLCTPLGLNHLAPFDFELGVPGPPYPDWATMIRGGTPAVATNSVMGRPKDLEEHNERARTFWLTFAVDRWASASTDWSTSIDEKDISTHLPCATLFPDPSLYISPTSGRIDALSLQDPNFLHPSTEDAADLTGTAAEHGIGSMGLYIKGTVLLGRVVNYLQRLPRYQCVPPGESCSSMKVKLKASAEFTALDLALSKFRTTTKNIFNSDKCSAAGGLDGFMASAFALPHVASILLHEPFTDRYDRSPTSSLARCLTSAKCVVNSTYLLYQSGNDLSGVDPFLPFTWSVVGRALIRDASVRRLWGEMENHQNATTFAEHCLMFLKAFGKTKAGGGIGDTLASHLQLLLDDPDRLIPMDGREEDGCVTLGHMKDRVKGGRGSGIGNGNGATLEFV